MDLKSQWAMLQGLYQKQNSQLEKEGLACVFGVKKFHSYLFGHLFKLVTDHKQLLTLLSEYKARGGSANFDVVRFRKWPRL